MHVEDVLKITEVRQSLTEHYSRSVRAAVTTYSQHAADEDSLTGALGQSLAGRGSVILPSGDQIIWVTTYQRFRSGGYDAAEKRLGGDGILEIEVTPPTGLNSRKSLVFQAKNDETGYGDARLRRQARQLASLPGSGIIINYNSHSYSTVNAKEIAAHLHSTRLNEGHPLEAVLSNEFLGCFIGSASYYYDAFTESIFIHSSSGRIEVRNLPLQHRIRTTIAFWQNPFPQL